MGTHNAVTLFKKADAALGMMVRQFAQSALGDGEVLNPTVRAEVVQLQADIKAQILHIEKTGQLEQPPHPSGEDRATRQGRFGSGKGGGINNEAAVKLRAERVALEKAEIEAYEMAAAMELAI